MNEKVTIKIYGSGCAKCQKAEEIVNQYFSEKKIEFEIQKIKDKKEILNSGIMVTPAVEFNGNLLFHGRLPRTKELDKWLSSQK